MWEMKDVRRDVWERGRKEEKRDEKDDEREGRKGGRKILRDNHCLIQAPNSLQLNTIMVFILVFVINTSSILMDVLFTQSC